MIHIIYKYFYSYAVKLDIYATIHIIQILNYTTYLIELFDVICFILIFILH